MSLRLFLLLLPLVCILGCGGGQTAGTDNSPSGVILLRYKPGSESTFEREEGFLEEMKTNHPEIHILESEEFAGTTLDSSIDKVRQLLLKHGDKVEGIFAVCEPNAQGTLTALDDMGRGDVPFVGFDPNAKMVEALSQGEMQGIVLQDPVAMGNLAVKAMVAKLEGELPADLENRDLILDGDKIRRRIGTGQYVATPDNFDSEEITRLLNPPQFSGAPPAVDSPKYRIAVIPKGTTHEFWKSVHFGAQSAADELTKLGIPVEILYKGPAHEDQRVEQITLVQNFITKDVDGIVLAPLDSKALAPVVNEAYAADIPVVIFDSGIDGADDYVSYVATDNREGGKLAAKCLVESLTTATPQQ